MTGEVAERAGGRHLAMLARWPRPAGSVTERVAREYAASELTALGFDVREEPFTYSAFPGRFATPIAGVLLGATIALTSGLALAGRARASAALLAGGVAATAVFARWMLADGVLTLPWLRTHGVNLAATRGSIVPTVWLVAHLDSKSQPVPSAVRIAATAMMAFALVLACVALLLTLAGVETRTIWWGVLAAGVAGALPLGGSVVGSRSDGALDNASGVAAVLVAAARVGPHVACGVLLPSAEELGLAGVRAWARVHAASVALNCDGVDDEGALVTLYNRPIPHDVIAAVRRGVPRHMVARARRMPLGLLTDSTALAAKGWRAVTVSHGSLASLRRVHTPGDTLANLRGTSIDDVAGVLARAAEALGT